MTVGVTRAGHDREAHSIDIEIPLVGTNARPVSDGRLRRWRVREPRTSLPELRRLLESPIFLLFQVIERMRWQVLGVRHRFQFEHPL